MLTLDHVDVISSISDGQRHGFLIPLHQTHNVSLLLGCDTTADDCFALTGHVHKVNLGRRLTPFVIIEMIIFCACTCDITRLKCATCFVVPVASPSPSRPWAVRPEGRWEVVAFPGDVDADDGVSSSFHIESRSGEMKAE